jgi:predicted DNA-binding transcriptional regulator YafY
MELHDVIERATAAHEPVRVIYHGGSAPGMVRTITPIELLRDQVRARCHVTGAAKLFKLDRLELATGDAGEHAEYTGEPAAPAFDSLSDVLEHAIDTLEGMGWVVRIEEEPDRAAILLARRFKNGKPRKTPDVSLSWERYSVQEIFDGESFSEERHEKTRPYSTRAQGESTRSFSDLDRAAHAFLECASKHRPESAS